ncbi:MAG: Thiol-disulfide isomerase and thioredoxin [Capsulimonas sp.]|jgi:peroxiredoxin/outer membrane lipoprotein-sorting protein|nr:Thiol-disulfide isomerase and thioredoxin [Capsulimonas sp.]
MIKTTGKAQTIGVLMALGAMCSPPYASAAPSATLADAKTIQVQETLLTPGQKPSRQQMTIRIIRPNKIHIEMAFAHSGGDTFKRTSYFVTDGKAAHEYNGQTNNFMVNEIPKAGQGFQSSIYNTADVDAILTSNQEPNMSGVKRTSSVETMNGRKLNAFTYIFPSQKDSEDKVILYQKMWFDRKTGLPFRLGYYIKEGGKTSITEQRDFTAWKLNKPIPVTQFAWAPPAGATKITMKSREQEKLLAAGTPAPDFTATMPDGTPVKLSDLKGKIVVLDFWATWCAPCQMSMPHLEKVYQAVKDKDVAVLGVCVWDDKKAYDKWVVDKKSTYSFPTAFDPAARASEKSIASKLYNVSGIPTQYIIDRNGKVAATTVGYDENDHVLEKALVKLGVDIPAEPKSASVK